MPRPELSDAEIDQLLQRLDRTERRLQRRIIARFISDRAAFAGELLHAQQRLTAMADDEVNGLGMPQGSELRRLARRIADTLSG